MSVEAVHAALGYLGGKIAVRITETFIDDHVDEVTADTFIDGTQLVRLLEHELLLALKGVKFVYWLLCLDIGSQSLGFLRRFKVKFWSGWHVIVLFVHVVELELHFDLLLE